MTLMLFVRGKEKWEDITNDGTILQFLIDIITNPEDETEFDDIMDFALLRCGLKGKFIICNTSEDVDSIKHRCCDILEVIITFVIFFFLYRNWLFRDIYEYFLYTLDFGTIWSEIIFVVIVTAIYFISYLIISPIRCWLLKNPVKEIFRSLGTAALSIFAISAVSILYLMSLLMEHVIWSIIPFVLTIIFLGYDIFEFGSKYMKLITPRAIIFLSAEAIVLIGSGLVCYKLVRCPLFYDAMEFFEPSPSATLLGIILIALPLVKLFTTASKKLRPLLMLPVSSNEYDEMEKIDSEEESKEVRENQEKLNIEDNDNKISTDSGNNA